jgi:hypothetical protein
MSICALKCATDDALVAMLSYRRGLPVLETANSLFESLGKSSPSAEDEEWREQLRFLLAEVLETGEGDKWCTDDSGGKLNSALG